MIWFLIVCSSVSGGSQCLPAQVMPSREACMFVAKGYTEAGRYAKARCRGVRKS